MYSEVNSAAFSASGASALSIGDRGSGSGVASRTTCREISASPAVLERSLAGLEKRNPVEKRNHTDVRPMFFSMR